MSAPLPPDSAMLAGAYDAWERNRIGQVGPAERLDEQEPQGCSLSLDGARRKLAIAEQVDLILANVVWT